MGTLGIAETKGVQQTQKDNEVTKTSRLGLATQSQISITLDPRKIVLLLAALIVGLTALSVLGHTLQYLWGRERFVEFVRLFNLGGENNIPTWYASATLFLCALLSAYIAAICSPSSDRYRGHWVGLALIFLLLSLDETAVIHDRTIEFPLVAKYQPHGILAFPWVVLGWILVAAVALAFYRFWQNLPKTTRWHFAAAVSTYVTGGLILEMANAYLMDYHVTNVLLRGAVSTIAEFMEMSGVLFFIYAFLYFISRKVLADAAAEIAPSARDR